MDYSRRYRRHAASDLVYFALSLFADADDQSHGRRTSDLPGREKRVLAGLIEDAEQDIIDIYDYIALSDSIEKADYVIKSIEEKCLSLAKLSDRGHFPPELERIGIFEYREIHFKPYRIIYQVINLKVYVHCSLDGRRELQKLLENRLLR